MCFFLNVLQKTLPDLIIKIKSVMIVSCLAVPGLTNDIYTEQKEADGPYKL